jgi:hypothetical protein
MMMAPFFQLLIVFSLLGLPTHAFLVSSSSRRGARARRRSRCGPMAAASSGGLEEEDGTEDGGKGFMLRMTPPPTQAPQQTVDEGERIRKEWERAYKAYVKKNGAQLCALAWRGYQKEGRGAIVAKQRADQSMEEEEVPEGLAAFEGVPSAMYTPLRKWMEGLEAAAAVDGDVGLQSGALRQILERVMKYDPEEDFVMVFETPRLCGADIVRPSITPPIMAARLLPEEGDAGVEEGGVINVEGQAVEE